MSDVKIKLLKKIFEEYEKKFENCREEFITDIYNQLIDENLHEYCGYGINLEEIQLNDLSNYLNRYSNLEYLLDNTYDGSYETDWGNRNYKSMLDSNVESDIVEDLGVGWISTFIENTFSEEFNKIFMEELNIEEGFDKNDVDTCCYYEICENYASENETLEGYYNLMFNPECVVHEWLEEEEIDVTRILRGKFKKCDTKFIAKNIKSLIDMKPSDNLKNKMDKIILKNYKKCISLFIFEYIQKKIIMLINENNELLNKTLYEYKKCSTVSQLLEYKDNDNKVGSLFNIKFKEDNKFVDFIKLEIFNSLTVNYVKNNYSKIQDKKLVNIIKNEIGEAEVKNLLYFSNDELNQVIESYIRESIKENGTSFKEISQIDPYELYKNGAMLKNDKPLFVISEFNFTDRILEGKLVIIFENLSKIYKLSNQSDYTVEDINILINETSEALSENLYDRPTMVIEYMKKIKDLMVNFSKIQPTVLKKKSNSELLNQLIRKLAKIQSYILTGVFGGNVHDIEFDEIADYNDCLIEIIKTDFETMLSGVYISEHIKSQLKEMLSEDPKDEFPLARKIKRHFILNVGLTNTGKTYNAIERLKSCENNGVYLAPLRLLALEIQEKLNKEGILCNLSTGEEENIIENATHESLTIEKADFNKEYGICVIDECQMIGDTQRGYAWTNAILGIYSKEIHLCLAPEGLPLIISLINSCGDTYDVLEHERKTPLIMEESNYSMPSKKKMGSVQEGDALIVFSKKQALIISAQLRNKGIQTSVVYGALPYKSRKKQFEMFLNKESKVIVCTDAIGMGVNLPIKRIVFLEDSKFDGKKVRTLNSSEVKQIAGRAGRLGIYDKGFVNAIINKGNIKNLLNSNVQEINKANILPPKTIINTDNSLERTIKVWNKMDLPDLYKKGDTSRLLDMLIRLKNYENILSKSELYSAITLPFDEKQKEVYLLFKSYLNTYTDKETELKKPKIVDSPILEELEIYYKKLDLYYAFSRTFNMDIDFDWLEQKKSSVSDKINTMIIGNINNIKKKCPQCGKKLDFTWEHKLCNDCYSNNRTEYYDYY